MRPFFLLLTSILLQNVHLSYEQSQDSQDDSEKEEENSPISLNGRDRACDVLIAIDEPLWERYDQNISQVVDLAKDHIEGLNQVFASQVFIENYQRYYFNLKRVQVIYGSCQSHLFKEDYTKNCTEQREVFLKAFDRYDTTEFCLAYVLTYLDFHNGTAGLASVGTACRKIQNTGFITLVNYGLERGLDESILTIAHEVAHNFNATHDNVFEDDPECYNKGFIMDELYNSTHENKDTKNKFSPCSLRSMKSKMAELSLSDSECFSDLDFEEGLPNVQVALCGNDIVEDGEECDCGLDDIECNDPCCYPARISSYERRRNESAMSCSTNSRPECLTRPGITYGFYVPLAVIISAVILICIILQQDWSRNKSLFTHVTKNNIKIVKS